MRQSKNRPTLVKGEAEQGSGVQGVENCAVYLAPIDRPGKRMLMRDKNGCVLEMFEIDIPGAAPVSAPAGVKLS